MSLCLATTLLCIQVGLLATINCLYPESHINFFAVQARKKVAYVPAQTAQALAFLANYARLRIDQAAADSSVATPAANTPGDTEMPCTACEGPATAVQPAEDHQPSISTATKSSSPSVATALAAVEVAYNSGRFFHQMGLWHMARGWYRRCLGVPLPAAFSSGTLKREAAFNLTRLLKESGEMAEALEITVNYLSL